MNTSLDLESLHRRASGHYLRGEFDAAMRVWRELLEHAPKDVRACEGVRLCEELARQIPAEGPVPQVPADAPALDRPLTESAGAPVPMLLEPEPLIELEPQASFAEQPELVAFGESGEAAALELERRVAQLVEDARESARRGDGLAALKIIERVLILDEENEAALELQSRLTSREPEEPPAPSPSPDPAVEFTHAALSDLDDLADLDVDARPAVRMPEGWPARQPEAPGPTAEAPPATARVAEPPAAVRTGSARRSWKQLVTMLPRLPRLPRLPQGRWVRIAAAAALGGALLASAWWLWRPGGGSPPEAVSAQQPPSKSHAHPPGHAAAQQAPVTPPPGPAAPAGESLAGAIARGDAAAAAKDWAAAVLAYDRASKLAPADLEVRKKFQIAAAAYQVQRREQERWDEAFSAFKTGNYEEALRCFYRMPGSETDAQILDYETRSWFNLGVNALRGRDCRAAASAFEEARQIRPTDKEIQGALALAKDCGKTNAVTFPLDVAALELRRLGD